ncbi:MAG: thiamine phosphate synthase [Dehalococcoidia bacterium]
MPCLMLITDRARSRFPIEEAVRRAVAAGVDAVQLREKAMEDGPLYQLATKLRRLTGGHCPLIVNGRLDIALAAGADGVHLPECGLPLEAARRLAPPGFLIGRSVHSTAAARAAEAEGAGYVQLGTIFATESKLGKEPDGLALVRNATSKLAIPCLAVGGITAANAHSVIAAGAQGVAVIGAILQQEEIETAVRLLRQAVVEPSLTSDT